VSTTSGRHAQVAATERASHIQNNKEGAGSAEAMTLGTRGSSVGAKELIRVGIQAANSLPFRFSSSLAGSQRITGSQVPSSKARNEATSSEDHEPIRLTERKRISR